MLRECHALKKTRTSAEAPIRPDTFLPTYGVGGICNGQTVEEGTMIKLMIDAVLFSCMGALIAGGLAGGAVFISY